MNEIAQIIAASAGAIIAISAEARNWVKLIKDSRKETKKKKKK
ncbi:hypothetical protein [Corynebacterium cystitidis]|nr:hypothetical protein [Corynebacterium cystitidis]